MLKILLKTFFILVISMVFVYSSEAGLIDDLKSKINKQNTNIKQLEEEINQYEEDIVVIGKEKNTLKKAVRRLDTTRKKIRTNIRLTESKIGGENLNIKKLEIQINGKKLNIYQNKKALSETIRNISENDSNSFVEILLSQKNISDFWIDLEDTQRLQKGVAENVKKLEILKTNLELNKKEKENKKRNLVILKSELSDQKKIVDNNIYQKNKILKKTKKKESNYKKLLRDKKRLKEAFERELLAFESQLKIAIDPNGLPSVGSGVLAWPLSKVFITQYFGNTRFAKSGAYKGHGHNGMDFRASVGTKVKAALGGTIIGLGNTDAIPGCYSYGKWVLIKHNNGLSTLYAHLSLIKSKKGDRVSTGQTIAYSGNTGYSTGPHLHLTVYASQGVKVTKFTRSINCKNAYIPLAPLNAYLNPLDYL